MTIKVLIDNMGSSGEGVGRLEGLTVFVEGALPGEEVEARVFKKERRYAKARLVQIARPSEHRVEPPCKYFESCGGCQIMHLSYDEQLRIKRQKVTDAFQRIGKIECQVEPCLPSPSQLGYRNKIQAQVQKGKMGFYARMSNDLVEVDSCKIHHPVGDRVYQQIKNIHLKHLVLKTAVSTGEVLVILVTNEENIPKLDIPGVVGVVQAQENEGNVVLSKECKVLQGRGYLLETICGLEFKVSPTSFFQVNTAQAENLYQEALAMAQLKGDETVLDAYCGVGTMALLFAQKCKQVIGIECVEEAITDANDNAARNNIDNATFKCGQAEQLIDQVGKVDVILLNPPRKGCEKSFLDGIERLKPERVVYVSCDPATLARDIALLPSYQVEKVQPFDMFPQTAHVETVVQLRLK